VPPVADGSARATAAGGKDMADWLIDVLADPLAALEAGGAAGAPDAPATTAALAAAWRASPLFAQQMGSKPSAPPLALETPFARAQ
jgi:hypothetical protein